MATITLTDIANSFTATTAGDRINGAGGDDTLTASDGGNALYGGLGDDVLRGRNGNDTLVGDDAALANSHNIMRGLGGADIIVSQSWSDQINAGRGNDTVTSYAQRAGQVVDGGDGYDLLSIQSLSRVNDPVYLQMGATVSLIVKGIAGATYVNFERLSVTLGTGSDTVIGGAGADTVIFAYTGPTSTPTYFHGGSVNTGRGNDSVTFFGLTQIGTGIEQLTGGKGYDSLTWRNGNHVIGDMTIDATIGRMVADGFNFANFSGFERLSFQVNEIMTGEFLYKGRNGIDELRLGAAYLDIRTGGGSDNVVVLDGLATVYGGAGDDYLGIDTAATGAAILYGNAGQDTLQGGATQVEFYGGGGRDVMSLYNSHSRMYGGTGNDVMLLSLQNSTSGSGAAVVDGGAGQDVLTLKMFPATTPIGLDLSTPSVTLGDGTLITRVEGIIAYMGQAGDDVTASQGAGGARVNQIFGIGGNDTLRATAAGAHLDGGFGADVLLGKAGRDVLVGGYGAEADTLRGGGGNDTLIGSGGRDFLFGGQGADHFTLSAYSESGTTATTRDRIFDFNRAEHDVIDLRGVDANQSAPGLDAFTFIGTAGFDGHAGQLRYERVNKPGQAHDYTLVSGDINGDGFADFSIELKGLFTLDLTDFAL